MYLRSYFFFDIACLQGYRICPLAPIFREKISGFIFLIWCVLHVYRICLLGPIFHNANLHKQTTKKFSKVHCIIRQKIKRDTFWDQNHNGLSVKNVKILLNIGAFWSKKQRYQMWHLLGSKLQRIIGSRTFALYYRRVLSDKVTLSNVTTFGIKITLDYWST